MIVWLEMGFITPPVGINLFVIQGVAKGATMKEITWGATPYGSPAVAEDDASFSLHRSHVPT